jgi:8-oxo-dGTP diphosphatase
MSERWRQARRVADIDWRQWRAREPASLVLVRDAGRLLLIHKKRGLGAGKISAPGGRMAPDESALACAVREVREELHITPTELTHAGENRFQFADGYSIHVQVFVAAGHTGVPEETDEAVPLWVAETEIPYDRMWADDRLWLPLALAGRSFRGRFVFDGDTMLDAALEV